MDAHSRMTRIPLKGLDNSFNAFCTLLKEEVSIVVLNQDGHIQHVPSHRIAKKFYRESNACYVSKLEILSKFKKSVHQLVFEIHLEHFFEVQKLLEIDHVSDEDPLELVHGDLL